MIINLNLIFISSQTLNLIDSRPISSQIPSPTSPQKHECAIKGDKPEPKKSTKPWSQKQSQQKDFEMRENYQMVSLGIDLSFFIDADNLVSF